ncbi:MAG: hypothetical protein K6A30_05970 [Lachnospiraceae bacterium]|nr:hypothetical protein [Lachnospiraceae bacterium]
MKSRAPITDYIDVRNFKDDLKNSVVKRSRIRFVPNEEQQKEIEAANQEAMEPDVSNMDPDVLATADEIFQRLQREAEEDNLAKQEEWTEKIAAENAKQDDSAYNATTGSYSGNYGKGAVSDETKDIASSILNRKSNDLEELIRNNSQQ